MCKKYIAVNHKTKTQTVSYSSDSVLNLGSKESSEDPPEKIIKNVGSNLLKNYTINALLDQR